MITDLMKHRNPQTLAECADAIEAGANALNVGYLVRSLRENAYPIGGGGTHSVVFAASIIKNACDRTDAIFAEEREKALASAKGSKTNGKS
jgi:hypothetical protein